MPAVPAAIGGLLRDVVGKLTTRSDAQDPPATDRPWPLRPEEVGMSLRQYELMIILDPEIEVTPDEE